MKLRLELVTESCSECESVNMSGIWLLQVLMIDTATDKMVRSYHKEQYAHRGSCGFPLELFISVSSAN